MKKCLRLLTLLAVLLFFTGCSQKDDAKVIIYTSAEEYRVEDMTKRLEEAFPEYNIVIEYMPTGNHAAKLLSEGTDTECDITYDLEYGYLEKLEKQGILTELADYDFTKFSEETISSKYYQPELKNGGAIVVSTKVLQEKGLEPPQCYEDLLKPEYKGLISMPNPKSSGTGYIFYKSLVNAMGEKEALSYFERLAENILQFTSSGSGPVNALIQGEVAIGLGMTSDAVRAINEGNDFEILYFEEGSPYCLYGQAIISGKEKKQAVKDVYEFLSDTYVYENCEKFFPEKIFKDRDYVIENYPENIKYADMGNDSIDEKERLLSLWKY